MTPHPGHNTPNRHIGEQEPSGPRHHTHVRTKDDRGTGNNKPHPMGRAHWGDSADPSGQQQGWYPKTAGPSPARLHHGPWQTSPAIMGATGDRRAGTQPRRGSPAKQRWPANQATGVRWSYRRLMGAISLVVRDTPHGLAAPRAAAQTRGHVALPMDTCGTTLSAGTTRLGGRNNALPSTCKSGLRGT